MNLPSFLVVGVSEEFAELRSCSRQGRFTVSDKERFEPGKEVKGQLVKVEGEKYFVRESSGNVVQMHVDATTDKRPEVLIKTGDYVNAKVNAQGHATSFLTDPPTSH